MVLRLLENAVVIREFTVNELWFLISATRWTVLLTLVSFVGGGIVGLIVALMRVSKSRPIMGIALSYIKVFQGTPLLMQLYLVYFGSSMLGFGSDPWTAVALAFTLFASAFLGEIWRGCIQAIPRGQWEGARSLALSYPQQMRYVILPQALRIATPPTVGFLVTLLKATSLASIIGFAELTRTAQMVNNATFRPFTVYASVAGIYFALCWPMSWAAAYLERRLASQHMPSVKVEPRQI
jgi:polar amino acid transport system permease protein